MPTMASITVKKKDDVTNIVYDAIAASGGDTSPAIWRQDTGAAAGLPVGLRPLVKMFQSWNGPKTARTLRLVQNHPYTVQDTTTTLYSSRDGVKIDLTVTVPQSIPSTNIGEAVYQAMNIAAHSLVKQSFDSGYAPN